MLLLARDRGRIGALLVLLLGALAAFAAPPASVPEQAPPPRPLVEVPAVARPAWLPRYDLDIDLRPDEHVVHVKQRVTWTNRHRRTAAEIVFNAHSHYQVPAGEVGLVAKTVEILRLSPSEAVDFVGRRGEVTGIRLDGQPLQFHYREDSDTTLVVPLPTLIPQGQSVTLELDFTLTLPQTQGRWGQFKDVTFLTNWLPVLAVYDDDGWQPVPFIPWHQPFFNEAGVYTARLTLPCGLAVGTSGTVVADRELEDGRRQLDLLADGVRDFAILCSRRYLELTAETPAGPGGTPVQVRCLALPEHEHYAREMLRTVCEVMPVYARWFGPYPYPQFTIAESFFGWNGNECGSLIMIDARVFGAPHLAGGWVEYLVAHETCHQWWYNLVGTNGYCETWMDEGIVTYFTHRYLDAKHGKNNTLLKFPSKLEWLPNIRREDYRSYGFYGTVGRGEHGPVVRKIDEFGHIINLFSMCYDKGSRLFGMIEDRMGETAFLDFVRGVACKYRFRILRIADFRRELEEYTGRSWEDFFTKWLYGSGLTDWAIDKVKVRPVPRLARSEPSGVGPRVASGGRDYDVEVFVRQCGEINEPTVLGVRLFEGDDYQLRLPVVPSPEPLHLDEPAADIETLPDGRIHIKMRLPCRPKQIAVDPDRVLVDRKPSNNFWKTPVRFHLTPLYTMLDDTDLTAAYDRINVNVGPWIGGSIYSDPWFTRSALIGARAGVYRTQQYSAGVYTAFRSDDRAIVAGVDGLLDHWPFSHTQVGFVAEQVLKRFGDDTNHPDRGVLFGRYVLQYASSLYLPPMHYVELFGAVQSNMLPETDLALPGTIRFEDQTQLGLHYHLDYLTPYWDPEGGFRVDATYAAGLPIFGQPRESHQVSGQFSTVKRLPESLGVLSQTRLAARLYGAAALPDNGVFFPLGGGQRFRGFDLGDRQGSAVWVASLEWRVPLVRDVSWDCYDHVAGVRNIYAAAFWDVGDAYVDGQSLGTVAHALGLGVRVDVAVFNFIERTTFRLDVAKAVNADKPVQVWLGVLHPF